jgi:alpha-L-arabinofuranosidase
MIFGESFEDPQKISPKTNVGQSSYAWQSQVSSGLVANISLDLNKAFAGQASQHIVISPGTSTGSDSAGVSNRGLGNEGLYLRAGKEYEGYFFAFSNAKVTLEVRLENHVTGAVLAKQRIEHSGEGFLQHEFTLTPSAGTDCHGIAPGSDPSVHCTNNPGTAHVCIKCGGQFVVALVSDSAGGAPGSNEVWIDYVVLQPGDWGRFHGLNARKDVAETLQTMGVKAIRLGGSFCSVTEDNGVYYQWQKWTGPVWSRPSVGAHWDSYGGNAYNLIGGWGPFEMIDYAVALGAEPIITTTETSTPGEFADLVEYCWGNASTKMGAQRIADGHPAPYKLKFIELGNEQYNSNYIAQVQAMEERAKAVGAGGKIRYIFPDNGGVHGDDIAKAAALGLGAQLVTDLHVGASGALPQATSLFEAHTAGGLEDDAVVNFETNAASHNHGRALDEAADLNAFFNAGEARMLARTASFCTGRAGHYDMFDQAISYFLPNMTFLQPPGHVHAMITKSWAPHVLNSTIISSRAPPSWKTFPDMALACSSSEYRGDVGVQKTAADCLEATKKHGAANYAVYQTNKNCYICDLSARGPPSTWKLTPTKGATSFEGVNVIQPLSASAYQSEDKKTIVARVVNHGSTKLDASLTMTGPWKPTSATAECMASADLNAENSAADVGNVAPRLLTGVSINGAAVNFTLPAFSYAVVTAIGA